MKNEKMKKLSVALICILFGFTAAAQQPTRQDEYKSKPPSPTEMLKRITKDLNLTAIQQTQFKIFLDNQDAKQRPTDEERKTRGENDRKLMDVKLKTILTQTQYAKWQDIKSKRKPVENDPPRV
ncbi:MAG: hypothetical protein H7221_08985 [Flavobacterium sp.]|nr:hypothetical protein [Flavobacterium sp.]